ncbi:MAG: flagellar type III secretion system pore protein FliP [Phycisphaerales bacterium]
MSRVVRIIGVLIAMVIAVGARGQDVYGPPAPGSAQAGAISRSPSLISDEGVNPLEILAGAGEVLNKPRSGEDVPARSGLSTVVNILVVLTVISLVPSIMLMTTCFTRIIIVLGLLKQALGAQSIPPPQVITALAMFMTMLVMAPTLDRINKEAIAPYRSGIITTYDELWDKAKQPVRDFMFSQIEATGNWSSLYMVMDRRGIDVSDPSKLTRANVDLISLVPAFMLSELKTAFLMGFRVYLPFLVIDIVISTMLIAMGMMMLPPVLISLPFKLLLFVLVDGWALVVGSLMDSVIPATVAVAHPSLISFPFLV